MRSIPFVLAAFVASGPAAAQNWEEYSYPKYAFAVVFPAKPQVEETTYQVADNRMVPAQVYSVRQGDVIFKMTVAELAGTNLEESAIIDHAIKTLSQGATVRQISDQARGLREAPRFQEPFGGLEGQNFVSQRLDEVSRRLSDGLIVVDDRNCHRRAKSTFAHRTIRQYPILFRGKSEFLSGA
jgi:hypothetical protein